MFKAFFKKLIRSVLELILKLIGFKSLCWVIATYAFFKGLMTSMEWIGFTSAVIGTKFAKDIKGLYPKILKIKKGSEDEN